MSARRVLNPYVMAVALYAVVLGSVMFAGRDWIGYAFVASMAFSLLNPLACALREAWWRETLVSGAALLGTLVLYGILDQAGVVRLREDSLAFLGPVTLYLLAAPASGLIRLIRWKRAGA